MGLGKNRIKDLQLFQEHINYRFDNLDYLNTALSHSSYINELGRNTLTSNERLEFLGDAVLEMVISDYLFRMYGEFPEGVLTKIRAGVVSEASLAYIAREISLGKYLLLGKGEAISGGRERPSILADAMESTIAAVFLDGGFDKVKEFVLQVMNPVIKEAVKGDKCRDYKTCLQETLQKDSNMIIDYEITMEKGPDHNKLFYAIVRANKQVLGNGKGRTKKEAEQSAAKAALDKLGDKGVM